MQVVARVQLPRKQECSNSKPVQSIPCILRMDRYKKGITEFKREVYPVISRLLLSVPGPDPSPNPAWLHSEVGRVPFAPSIHLFPLLNDRYIHAFGIQIVNIPKLETYK